jgi:tetratricopeptide (TPR) repeat protein
LQRSGYLSETSLFPDLEYSFKHTLTYEVAYASLLRDRRRALHAEIMAAMERLYADRLASHTDRLAHHAWQAERWSKAVEYHGLAGRRAIDRAANEEAVSHFERAREALGRLPAGRVTVEQAIDLRLAARAPLLQLGRLPEALALSHEAERLAQDLGDERTLARVYAYLINHHYLKGEPELAIQYGERCLTVGQESGDLALQATARQYMGQSLHVQGEYRRAESILRANVEALEAVAETQRLGPLNVPYVASCGWLAFSLSERGEFTAARDILARGRRVAEAANHPYSQMIASTLVGLVAVTQGRHAAALLPLEQSLEASREKHLTVWAPLPSSLLGLTFVRLGRPDEGRTLLHSGVARSEELGVRAYLARWVTNLGEGLLVAGLPEEARVAGERALDLARTHRERGHEAWAHRLLGQVATTLGDGRAAARHYESALEIARSLEMRPLLGVCQVELGDVHDRAGREAEAALHRTRGVELLRSLGMRPRLGAERSASECGQLFVVAEGSRDLQTFLERDFAHADDVDVIVDRRRSNRRRRAEPHEPDRRRQDRRQNLESAEDLRGAGVVIVPRPR